MYVQHMLGEPLKDQGHLALDKRKNGEKRFTERIYFNTQTPGVHSNKESVTVNICKGDDGPGKG